MKNKNYLKAGFASLALIITGCASSGGGNNMMGSVNSGLSSVEQAAQAGQQAISSGTTAANSITSGQVGLTDILVQQLGVSQQQALGGTGAIFQAAQASMSSQAFSVLSQSLPGMSAMLEAAPVVQTPLSGLSGMMGDAGSTLNNATSLATSFQQLNLSPDMIGQFIPIVMNYVRNTSGQVTADLLSSALTMP